MWCAPFILSVSWASTHNALLFPRESRLLLITTAFYLMYFQMEAQPDRLHSQNENRGEVDVSQRELLMEAFGSMNLGARTEDAARYGPLTQTQFHYASFLLGPYY